MLIQPCMAKTLETKMTQFRIVITGDANDNDCENVKLSIEGIEYNPFNLAEIVKLIRHSADKIEHDGPIWRRWT